MKAVENNLDKTFIVNNLSHLYILCYSTFHINLFCMV